MEKEHGQTADPLQIQEFPICPYYNLWAHLRDAWANPDGKVFTKEDGSPFFPDGLTQWFSAFVQRSDLPKVSICSLRHTYASLLIADGTPLVVVAHNMGHAQASTTANIYAHVIASAEAKAAQVTDRFADVIKLGGTKVAPTQPPSEVAGQKRKPAIPCGITGYSGAATQI